MGLKIPRQLLALAAGLALAGSMFSCAKGTGVDSGSGSSSGGAGTGGTDAGTETSAGGATGDSGFPRLGLGAACKHGSDCESGQCADIGQTVPDFVCTTPCTQGKPCPKGYCAFQPHQGYICIPDSNNECGKCNTNADCSNVGDLCVTSPKFDSFCARDCSFDGVCPSGYSCVAPDSYGPAAGQDAGASGAGQDSGASGAGQDAGGGEAGPQAQPPRVCVPDNGASCPCNSQRNGVKRTCEQTTSGTTCQGKETCNGSTGQWEGCTAGSPKPEVCDGADDNCDGVVDGNAGGTVPISQLCPGPTPPHSNWTCDKSKGACVAQCDQGWEAYPATLPASAGCTCQDDSHEPDNTCATAAAIGSVSDADPTALTVTGNLSSGTDEDWYKFDTVDTDEGTTNSYHIKIVFTTPAPKDNKEFVFDVIRGDQCATPDASHSDLTSYDWCVDGSGKDASGNAIGEATCGPTAPIHCGPHGKSYLVRVHRAATATGTCDSYTLAITARGGGACDFSQATGACDKQVSETSP